jgi:hypothetical protein
MRGLTTHYKMALKNQASHRAFDELLHVWDEETAAAVYQMGSDGVYGALDLLNLQSVVDNRREILTLRSEYQELLEQLRRLTSPPSSD